MHLGAFEILAILALALLFFGPTRLPGLGSSLGSALRSFKRGMAGLDEDAAAKASATPAALPPGQTPPPQA